MNVFLKLKVINESAPRKERRIKNKKQTSFGREVNELTQVQEKFFLRLLLLD